MNSIPLASIWPSDDGERAKYQLGNPNGSEDKVPPNKKLAFPSEDPSLNLPWKSSYEDCDYHCIDHSRKFALYEITQPAADARDPDIISFEIIQLRRQENGQEVIKHRFPYSDEHTAKEMYLFLINEYENASDE
ncbi:MAG: hypothetical protein O3C20_19360 [Verrucomicrobia bacterium]|nr:hypothetical protein [Verrucomicrobiota bacterium]